LLIREIDFYALTIKILIGCGEFTVHIILHFFETLAFEQNVSLRGFAICSDVVCSTRMWADGLRWHKLNSPCTKKRKWRRLGTSLVACKMCRGGNDKECCFVLYAFRGCFKTYQRFQWL